MYSNKLLILALSGLLAPSPVRAQEPLRAGSDVEPPKRTKTVQPVYPEAARKAWVQGVVVLEVLVDPRGDVQQIDVLRSIPLLDRAAIDAVQEWEYEPTAVDGQAVPVVVTVPLSFTLPGGDEWTVFPEGEAELELEAYQLTIAGDGRRSYTGTIKNVSDDGLSDVRAVVSYIERFPEKQGDGAESDIEPPRKDRHEVPVYPREAERRGIEGIVIANVLVDAEGKVENVRILSSIPPLDPAVREAVEQWEYEPAERNGVPVPFALTARVEFTEDEVTVDEHVAPEDVGIGYGSEVAELDALEPGESGNFALDVEPAEGRELNEIQLVFLVAEGSGSRMPPTSRQLRTLAPTN